MADSYTRPERKGDKKSPSWIRYIRGRIQKKKNFLGIITGPTGSGKSWAALSIALQLDKDFGPDRIIFGLEGLMELINSGESKLKAGSVIVWDEFQIGASSRDWQSMVNKMLNSLLSTFRHKQFIVILTSPYSDFIDASTRKMLHAEFEILSIDYKKKQSKIKPLLLQYNSRIRKTFFKYLRIKGRFGAVPLERWNVDSPPKWLIDEYEEMKTDFTSSLNKSIEEQLKASKEKLLDTRKPLTLKQEQVLENLAETNGDTEKAAKLCGVTTRTLFYHQAAAKKKGYTWENYTEIGAFDD